MVQRLLLTGATGYIGGRLAGRLARDGHQVAAVARVSSDTEALARAVPGLVLVRHDGDPERLGEEIAAFAPDALCHLAALVLPGHGPAEARALVAANVTFAVEVLAAAVAAGCRLVVDTGTFWQHGDGTDSYCPAALYAATKQAFQDLLCYYAQAVPLRATTLKLFQVYGPDDPRGRIIDLLLDSQATGRPLELSPGRQDLDLVHVDDVVAAYRVALVRLAGSALPRTSYAISTGRRLTLREVVALIERVTGASVPVIWDQRPYRVGEVMNSWGGPPLPGWRARVSLEEGIAELCRRRHRHYAEWRSAS